MSDVKRLMEVSQNGAAVSGALPFVIVVLPVMIGLILVQTQQLLEVLMQGSRHIRYGQLVILTVI